RRAVRRPLKMWSKILSASDEHSHGGSTAPLRRSTTKRICSLKYLLSGSAESRNSTPQERNWSVSSAKAGTARSEVAARANAITSARKDVVRLFDMNSTLFCRKTAVGD